MGKVYTTSEDLTSIANAIRAKSGSNSSLVYPNGFINEIGNISTGGNIVEEKDVNFYDYDGTIVASYTAAQFTNLSAFPSNPAHEGLTAQGWNWDLADAKTFVATYGKLNIGQMYITTSRATEIDITLDDSNYLSPYLSFTLNGTVEIDWGDNSSIDTVQGSSLSTYCFTQHIYLNTGTYTIKITVINGTCCFKGPNSEADGLLHDIGTTQTSNKLQNGFYSGKIQMIRVGNNIELANTAFGNCYNLQSITLPQSITFNNSCSYIFQRCYSIKFICIPKGQTKLGQNFFAYCFNLQQTSLPYEITTIQMGCFSYCCSLLNLIISCQITELSKNIFSQCYNIQYIIYPNTVTTIDTSTFYQCYKIKNINLPSTLTIIPTNSFNYCYNLQSIIIPSNVTKIDMGAFQFCKNLKQLNFPSNLTEIGSSAFYACHGLKSLTIPATVTTINNSAFGLCYSVDEYHFLSTTPPTLGTNVFQGIVTGTVIYVPYSSDHSILNAYKTATNWSAYADYIQEESAP